MTLRDQSPARHGGPPPNRDSSRPLIQAFAVWYYAALRADSPMPPTSRRYRKLKNGRTECFHVLRRKSLCDNALCRSMPCHRAMDATDPRDVRSFSSMI
jgi:hypothetical protein